MALDPSGIPAKMLTIHDALKESSLGHAFGGALALAWCTQQARGTIDIDLNVFIAPESVNDLLQALPRQVAVTESDEQLLRRDGQARLWWESTPVDVFLNTAEFHASVSERVRWEPFAGEQLPFLACDDLAVFKAFFDRTKDWADLEAMAEAGSLDPDAVAAELGRHLGPDDERLARLRGLGTNS